MEAWIERDSFRSRIEVVRVMEGRVMSRRGLRRDFRETGKAEEVEVVVGEVRFFRGGPVDFGSMIWERC